MKEELENIRKIKQLVNEERLFNMILGIRYFQETMELGLFFSRSVLCGLKQLFDNDSSPTPCAMFDGDLFVELGSIFLCRFDFVGQMSFRT